MPLAVNVQRASDDPAAPERTGTDRAARPTFLARVLQLAGIYNLVWGAIVILFPGLFFSLAGMEQPRYPEIWQCVGMIVGVYGIGYLIAATDPIRHWPIVLVGLLGKIFGPIGFAIALARGVFPPEFAWTILTNDLIWWIPFSMILWQAFRAFATRPHANDLADLRTELKRATDQDADSVFELSQDSPLLLVLLRHSGCTFCKETLAELRDRRDEIEHDGTRIVLVHMSTPGDGLTLAKDVGLEGVRCVSDPERRLYGALELTHGRFAQLFGPRVMWRGFVNTLRGRLPGRLDGDGFQMPGAFLIHRGEILRAHRHRDAAERPDYAALACSAPTS